MYVVSVHTRVCTHCIVHYEMQKNLENAKKSGPAATPPVSGAAPELSNESQTEVRAECRCVMFTCILCIIMCIHVYIQIVYRDRAKERRDKYGTPAIIPGWKKRLEREIDKASFSK